MEHCVCYALVVRYDWMEEDLVVKVARVFMGSALRVMPRGHRRKNGFRDHSIGRRSMFGWSLAICHLPAFSDCLPTHIFISLTQDPASVSLQ